MKLILKIAFRNLFRHKGRSIAIGSVIMIGVFFMILGMGTIAGMEKGITKNVIRGLVGEVTLLTADRKDDNLGGSFEPLEAIENFEEIQKTISALDFVDNALFQIYGFAGMLDLRQGSSDYDQPGIIILWGINLEDYYRMYGDNIVILEGEPLKPGEQGLLINVKQREQIFEQYDVWLVPENSQVVKENLTKEAYMLGDQLFTRNDLVLMGMSGGMSATDVRVPVKGIFKYRHLNDLTWTTNIIDIETSRETMGYISGDDLKTDLTAEQRNLLDAVDENPEALFSEDAVIEAQETDATPHDYNIDFKKEEKKEETVARDSGVYNVAQINLKPGMDISYGVRQLNQVFKDKHLDEYVRAVPWKKALPSISNSIDTFRIALMILVGIIYFAAILMITNALTMAAAERTAEIGTMRMVGAQKKLIGRMFVAETFLLSFLFGGLGIMLGMMAISFLSAAEITSGNNILLFLFGGDVYRPVLDISGVIRGIIQLIIITILAMAYPVIVARRIQPMDAIKRG